MSDGSKIDEVLRSLEEDRTLTSGLRTFRVYCECGRQSERVCDWKVAAHKTGTCDKPVCAQHSKEVAPGKFLCPEHQHRYDDWLKKRSHAVNKQASLFEGAA